MLYAKHIQILLATVASMYLALTSHFLLFNKDYRFKTSNLTVTNDDKRSQGHKEHAAGLDPRRIRQHDDSQQMPHKSEDGMPGEGKSGLSKSRRHLSIHTEHVSDTSQYGIRNEKGILPCTATISRSHNQQNLYGFNGDLIVINGIRLRLVINQVHICDKHPARNQHPYLLVQVHSHCQNKPQRDAIRATWGRFVPSSENVTSRVILTFLIGSCNMTPGNKAKIEHEDSLYRDILQWNFSDSYGNLTVKSLAGLAWARRYCNAANFVLKADDDLYVNIPRILSFTRTQPLSLIGHVYPNSKPARSGLWSVSKRQYPADVYPPYCSGTAYLMSNNTVLSLLKAYCQIQPDHIPIEDIYITGILARHSSVQCKHSPLFPSWTTMPAFQTLLDLIQGHLIGIHGVTYERMYHLHNVIQKCKECSTDLAQMRKWFNWIKRQKTYD